MPDFVDQRCVRQGCSLSLYLLNIFIDDAIDCTCTDKRNCYLPII
jgi:hypothetical protein